MINSTEIRITETERTALTRLLAKAKAEGVKLLRDRDGRHYASSVSQPGARHYVTGYSCDCRGFAAHGHCMHFAALLSAKGWLDTALEPDPAPAMVVSVAHVNGFYSLPGLNDRGGEWCEPVSTILVDGRETIRITGDASGIRVSWLEGGRVVDDMTACTPAGVSHDQGVVYWLESLGGDVPAHVITQDAGLFDAYAFANDGPPRLEAA